MKKKRARDASRARTDIGRAQGRENSRRFYHQDIEASRARSRERYALNRDSEIQKVVQRSKRLVKATPKWADQSAIAAIYAECRRIKMETGVDHHVDHILPLKGRFVSGLHVENNLQIITADQNRRKWISVDLAVVTAGGA